MNNTFKYFDEILKIPRPSGHENKIADFLVDFAKQRNFEVYRDKSNNVLINKNNNSNKTIILQGHIDMVCDSVCGFIKDYVNTPINYKIEDDYYKGDKTTLGADNGIGVAIILSLLEENNSNLPNIQALFTTEEETTMNGAKNFDYSKLKSKTLLSIDGIREGTIESSSAGICNYEIYFPKPEILKEKIKTRYVVLSGLQGGHSGDDINKHRENAISLLFNFLPNDSQISKMIGGSKANIIPNHAEVLFLNNSNSLITEDDIKKLFPHEKNLHIEGHNLESETLFSKEDSKNIIKLVSNLPTGTISVDKENFPITSANIGTIDNYKLVYSIRSSDKEELKRIKQNIADLCKKLGFKYKLIAEAPFFPFIENSKLRKTLLSSYKKLYNKEPKIVKIHACMEGGIFAENIENLDITVISPDVFDIHTINERVSISSTNRVYCWILETLKEISS